MAPSPQQIQAKIDLLISLELHAWPALTFALQNNWGGPASTDKRDWLAGAISDLISPPTPQVTHVDDLEEVLLQVMLDEFEVVVDDETAMDVALKIWKGRERIIQGDFGDVDAAWGRFNEKSKSKMALNIQRAEVKDGDETDWDSDDDDEEWDGFKDNDGDEEMGEAPQLVQKKEKPPAETDEDGFTKVVSKKKR